jgi:hypothetical protein
MGTQLAEVVVIVEVVEVLGVVVGITNVVVL